MSAHDDYFLSLFNNSDSIIHLDNAERRAPEIATLGRVGAAHLRSLGVEKGARVAIWMANSEQYLVALTACAAGGFVVVSVNTRYSAAEATDLIIRSGAALTLVDDSTPATPPGPTMAAAELLIGDEDQSTTIGTSDDHFVVFTTSGTTSKPKMVVHGQRSIAVHARNVATGAGITADDVVLVAMPLCGVFGLCTLTSALAAGSTVVMPTGFDVARTAELIERHQVTITHGSDDMFHRLLEHGADLGSMRWAGYGRFNTSLDGIVERAEASGGRLTGLYGMSEVQALFSVRDPSGSPAERTKAGGTIIADDASARVVDGELQLKGPSLFAGYLAEGGASVDDDLTADNYDDGWFRTGDLAEQDPSNPREFTYLSRMGDVLRLGGFLVSPVEIEAVLMGLDGVLEAQVVAVDRPSSARPVAFVISDGPEIDEAGAIATCRQHLARYKVPIAVLTIDRFPTTPSANGTKIQRVKLREIADIALR